LRLKEIASSDVCVMRKQRQRVPGVVHVPHWRDDRNQRTAVTRQRKARRVGLKELAELRITLVVSAADEPNGPVGVDDQKGITAPSSGRPSGLDVG